MICVLPPKKTAHAFLYHTPPEKTNIAMEKNHHVEYRKHIHSNCWIVQLAMWGFPGGRVLYTNQSTTKDFAKKTSTTHPCKAPTWRPWRWFHAWKVHVSPVSCQRWKERCLGFAGHRVSFKKLDGHKGLSPNECELKNCRTHVFLGCGNTSMSCDVLHKTGVLIHLQSHSGFCCWLIFQLVHPWHFDRHTKTKISTQLPFFQTYPVCHT